MIKIINNPIINAVKDMVVKFNSNFNNEKYVALNRNVAPSDNAIILEDIFISWGIQRQEMPYPIIKNSEHDFIIITKDTGSIWSAREDINNKYLYVKIYFDDFMVYTILSHPAILILDILKEHNYQPQPCGLYTFNGYFIYKLVKKD